MGAGEGARRESIEGETHFIGAVLNKDYDLVRPNQVN